MNRLARVDLSGVALVCTAAGVERLRGLWVMSPTSCRGLVDLVVEDLAVDVRARCQHICFSTAGNAR